MRIINNKIYSFFASYNILYTIIADSYYNYNKPAFFSGLHTICIIIQLLFNILLLINIKKDIFPIIKYHSDNDSDNAVISESRKLIKHSMWLQIVICISLIASLIITVGDSFPKEVFYAMSFILAAQLFALAAYHISFQSKTAKRLPPQFRKKGALYDEK